MRFLFNDSSGHPSWTVTISVWVCVVVTFKFLVNGITIPVLGLQPLMTVMDFVYAIGVAMSPMVVHKGITAAADATVRSADAKKEAAAVLAKAEIRAADVVATAKREEVA